MLIDIRHDPSANDKMMYDWMVYQGFTPIIIATKLDKIKRSQIQKNVKAIREGLKVKPGTVIIPFSSETKQEEMNCGRLSIPLFCHRRKLRKKINNSLQNACGL